jgi:hypothetical protein
MTEMKSNKEKKNCWIPNANSALSLVFFALRGERIKSKHEWKMGISFYFILKERILLAHKQDDDDEN